MHCWEQPQQVRAIADASYGKVILTDSLAIKCVKLWYVMSVVTQVPQPVAAAATVTVQPAQGSWGQTDGAGLIQLDDRLDTVVAPGFANSVTAQTQAPTTLVVPTPVYKQSRVVLKRMPTPADRAPREGSHVTSGSWRELPWKLDTCVGDLPEYEVDIDATRMASSMGIGPAYRGSCLVTHARGRLYNSIEYSTGLFTSCAWLRALVVNTLTKLHSTSPHTTCVVGVIVTDRVQFTLANMSKDQARETSKRYPALQKELSALLWEAATHGYIHMDVDQPHCIGISSSGRVFIVDWSKAQRVVLSKLMAKPGGPEVAKFICLLPEDVLARSIESKLGVSRGFWSS